MTKLDLQAEYARLNELIFQNRLPGNLTIKWNHSKKCLGKTTINQNGKQSLSFTITISKYFLCSDKEYIETLIHEMIHVQMAVDGSFRKGIRPHGRLFCEHMNRINHDFPLYTIKIREDESIAIDQSRMALQNGFLLITDNDKRFFNLYKHSISSRDIAYLMKGFSSQNTVRTGNLYIFQGKYEELGTAPVRSNLNTLSGRLQYFHCEDDMDRLIDKIKKGPHDLYKIEKKRSFIETLYKSRR